MKAEENEQLLQIVSDALHDGPGTPAWDEAMRVVGPIDADDIDALYQVRQRLESGKRWRQVRPGIGFTRKLMDAVDQQSDASVRATGPATIIAIVCGLLIVVVIAALVPMLLYHAQLQNHSATDEFQNVLFATPWVESDFENSISGDWTTSGNLKIVASHGLHASGAGYWGIASTQPLGADQIFAFDAKMNVPADGSIARMFVLQGGHELDAVVDAQHVQVILPGGGLAFSASRPTGSRIELRWLIGPASAALEINGQRVWMGANNLNAGPHDLASSRERSIGFRFILPGHQGRTAGIEHIEVRTKN